MSYIPIRVVRSRHVTPRMIRVTFTGDGLADYEAAGNADEYCRVFFPDGDQPATPLLADDGHELPSEDLLDAPMRNYTIRRFDRERRELDIDFVVHGGGVAAAWAQRAAVGDEVAIAPSHGDYDRPEGIGWQLLVADATALPALSRIVEEHSSGTRTFAIVIVADAGEIQELHGDGEIEWSWIFEPDDERIADTISRAVKEFTIPEGPGYIWVAGENRGAREARSHLRHTLGMTWDQYHTLGYWRTRAETWNRRYLAQRRRIEQRIDEVEEKLHDAPIDDYLDALDQVYVDAGLEE